MPLYLITSPSGKQYVGITTRSVSRRMNGHRTSARGGSPYPLHAAIRKYGFNRMKIEILHQSCDIEELHRLEIETIAARNTISPNGYNLTDGGEGTTGHTVTDENKLKLSACMSDRWENPEFVAMRKRRSHEAAANMSPDHLSAFQAGSKNYWTAGRLAERSIKVGAMRKSEPERFAGSLEALRSGANKYWASDDARKAQSEKAKLTRAAQSPERRKEIAQLAVAGRAKKRAEREAYLATLPAEQVEQIRAEARAKKSAETSTGRAKATPEQKAASKERYRQAALRRHAAKKASDR